MNNIEGFNIFDDSQRIEGEDLYEIVKEIKGENLYNSLYDSRSKFLRKLLVIADIKIILIELIFRYFQEHFCRLNQSIHHLNGMKDYGELQFWIK